MDPTLERAREELRAATDGADRDVRTQLESIDVGIFEEEGGDRTRDEPGPKPDRLAEIYATLEELSTEANGSTAERIDRARAAIREYMADHPRGG